MNDQLQNSLSTIMNKAMQGLEAGVSFLSGQLPDVIEQLLIWKLVVACVLTALGLIIVFLGAYNLYRYCHPKVLVPEEGGAGRYRSAEYVETFWHQRSGYTKDVADIVTIIGSIISVPALITAAVNVSIALQIWLAPKIYLIEYAASLAKGG